MGPNAAMYRLVEWPARAAAGRWRMGLMWWAVLVLAAALITSALVTSELGQTPLAQQPTERVDAPGTVVLDAVRELKRSRVEVIGWRVGGGAVEMVVDGDVVATTVADVSRPDVARAYDLANDRVGFSVIIDVDEPFLICATRPGSTPASGSYDRRVLDLGLQRAVALYGVPGVPVLGAPGAGSPPDARRRLEQRAKPYEPFDRPVTPVFEILATVAQASAGSDGDYSAPVPTEDLRRYLEEIRKIGGHLVLDFHSGQGDYLDQMRNVEALIIEPDVHVALDPE